LRLFQSKFKLHDSGYNCAIGGHNLVECTWGIWRWGEQRQRQNQ
jgi:hypothetical protein